jgi:hypothetical protein
MEVLRPQLITIDGRNYRKNPIQEKTYQHEEDDDNFYQGNPCSRVRLEVKCSLCPEFKPSNPSTVQKKKKKVPSMGGSLL